MEIQMDRILHNAAGDTEEQLPSAQIQNSGFTTSNVPAQFAPAPFLPTTYAVAPLAPASYAVAPLAPNPKAHSKFDRNSEMKKMVDTHMIVATLIATIAFTAGFTMPGGYIQSGSSNEGMAVFATKSTAFQAFVISDTTALLFSTSALFAYFLAANYNLSPDNKKEFADFALMGMFLNMFGLGAMIIAFITGTYAVLQYSSGIAIATCVVASCIFLIHGALLCKYFNVALENYAKQVQIAQ